MTSTRKELIKIRVQFVKNMHFYIITLNDDIWLDWVMMSLPLEATEEDYYFYASNDSQWEFLCNLFDDLINEFNKKNKGGDD